VVRGASYCGVLRDEVLTHEVVDEVADFALQVKERDLAAMSNESL
jgi:hypothetical protein